MAKHGENRDNELHIEIEAVPKINAQNIDYANYFMTLTSEAANAGILSESEILSMQSQIADMLADNIWQYNGGSSTSVTTEIAADLIESIVFILDCFCISAVKADDSVLSNERCIEILRAKAGVKNCYPKGSEYITQLVNYGKDLYNKLYINKLTIGIALYNSAINKSLAIFFNKYNARFFAHRINPSTSSTRFLEYPLALSRDIKDYKGILYVNEYMRYLMLENEFCLIFGIKDVQRLIKLYAKNGGFNVNDLKENIFERIFTNAFFSVFLDSGNATLFIKREQYDKIAENFYDNGKCKDEIAISDLISEHTYKLIEISKINNIELQKYILKYKKIFEKNILSAVQRNYLHNLITYDEWEWEEI